MKELLIALLVGVVITTGFEVLSEFAKQPGQAPAPRQQVSLPADFEQYGY